MKGNPLRIAVLVAGTLLALGALAPAAWAGQQAKWTFAVYMDSDNDLDQWAALNTQWLMSAPSSRDVNFLVLWDTATGPAKLFKVSHGRMTELTDFALAGTEVNMGDPATLAAFIDYVDSRYGARNVLLDLWDHGDDFRGICYDYHTGTEVESDLLTHQEIASALAGRHVDVIAGDGCGIGVVEAAYEYVVRGVGAKWFVANESYVPLQGFPYDRIAEDLVADPGMTRAQLSKDIVERYEDMYQKGSHTELAAIRLPAVAHMVDELWDVTSILKRNMKTYRGLVASARAKATMGWSQYGWEASVDFPMVFRVVRDRARAGSDLEAQSAQLLDAIAEAVPYVGMSASGYVWDMGGIAVFFPGARGSYVHHTSLHGSLYPTMQFAQDGWLDFLDTYFGGR